MLIAAGIAAFLVIFLGSPQNDLLLSKMPKYVKKIVVDKDTKQLIIKEVKETNKLQKAYQKRTKKYVKELNKLVENQSTSEEEFTKYFKGVVDYELETNKVFIPHRIAVQQALSQEEWDKIIEAGQKEFKKGKKANDKKLEKLKKKFDKTALAILKQVDDEKDKEAITNTLKSFNTNMMTLGTEIIRKNPYEQEILLNKDASEDDLFKVINEDNKQWMQSFDIFTALFIDLSNNVPEDNWKPVAKQLKKLIKL